MRVLWLTNIPSPYRVDFFNELGKYCELTVLFERSSSSERNDIWKKFNVVNFKAIILKGIKVGVAEAFCFDIIYYLNNTYDCIVITNFSDLTGMLAVSYLRAKKIPYIIESDGGFAGSGKGIKEKVKTWLLSKASLYFSTGLEHDRYYLQYGADKDRILRYPFTSLKDKDILREPISNCSKNNLRKKLNITEEYVVLSVGQFIFRKGFDVLIKAFNDIDNSVGCYIIGGEPTKEYLDLLIKYNITNVHFVSFKSKKDLSDYYKAADIFVLPTRHDIWGLVINEALAYGLPTITTSRCIAGLELINNPIMGQIVEVGESKALSSAIQFELNNLSYERSTNILSRIKQYTVEVMAAKHIDAFKRYICYEEK